MDTKNISVWVLNSKGGVGKTTLSIVSGDLLELSGRTLKYIEIDSRKRLSSFVSDGSVLSFDGAPPITEIRQNPNLVLKHYDPIVEAMEDSDSLLDLGANEDPAFLEYCRLSRLDEDLVDMGIQVYALVPTVAETESIKGALAALEDLKSVVPSSIRILVLNERDQGDFNKYFTPKELKKLDADGIRVVKMPRVLSEGWEDFQRKKMRFVDIIMMETSEIQEKMDYGRQMAKRARGDIAFWFDTMRTNLSSVFPDLLPKEKPSEESSS